MPSLSPAKDWTTLEDDDAWRAAPGGVTVVHQASPSRGEVATKFHGRMCVDAQHRTFRDAAAQEDDTTEWFRAPDAQSARAGGAVPCRKCGGTE